MDIDWSYYFNLPIWTVHQGACLLYKCDPNWLIDDRQLNDNPFIIRPKIDRLTYHLNMAVAQRTALIDRIDELEITLSRENSQGILSPDNLYQKINYNEITENHKHSQYIAPLKLINWAIEKKYNIPNELLDFKKDLELQAKSVVRADAEPRKKFKPKQRDSSESLLLIDELVKEYNVEYLDELRGPKAWGKIVSGKEFKSDLIEDIDRSKKHITLKSGKKIEKSSFLEQYRKRFF